MIIGTVQVPGQYTVQLSCNDDLTFFYVTYGLQEKSFRSRTDALTEFKLCALHAIECFGVD